MEEWNEVSLNCTDLTLLVFARNAKTKQKVKETVGLLQEEKRKALLMV